MDYTPNYRLLKPRKDHYYDIQDHNDNMDTLDREMKEISEKWDRGMVKQIQRGVAFVEQISEYGDCFLHVNISKTANMGKVFVSVGMPSERNTTWGLPNVKPGATATVVLVDEWTIRIATTYNNGVPLYVPWQVVEYY